MVNACAKILFAVAALSASTLAAPAQARSNPDAIDYLPGFGGRPSAPSPTSPRTANPDGIDYRPGFGGRLPLPTETAASSSEGGMPAWNPRFGHGPVMPSHKETSGGIPGWNPRFGHGPVMPTTQPVERSEASVEAGMPGWNPRFGLGPVMPGKSSDDEGNKGGIPGWNPRFGHGPVIPSHEPRSNPDGIDYLPGFGGRPAADDEHYAALPKPPFDAETEADLKKMPVEPPLVS